MLASKKILGAWSFLACAHLALAQGYIANIQRFSVEEGLPHRGANCVFEDYRGFVWVATPDGLARFNGHRSRLFSKKGNGLSSDNIRWLLEDADGNIWAVSADQGRSVTGLDIIDPVSEEVKPAAAFFGESKPFQIGDLIGAQAVAGEVPADRSLYFGVKNPSRLVVYHPKNGWKTVPLPFEGQFVVVKATAAGTIWGIAHEKDDPGKPSLVEVDLAGNVLHKQYCGQGEIQRFGLAESGKDGGFRLFLEGPNRVPTVYEVKPDGTCTDLGAPAPFYLCWWFPLFFAALSVWAAQRFLRYRARSGQGLRADAPQEEVLRQTATIWEQNEQLQQIDPFENRGLAHASHEFRAPISVILGMADLLFTDIEKAGGEVAQVGLPKVSVIQENGKNLIGLVNDRMGPSGEQSKGPDAHLVQGDGDMVTNRRQNGAAPGPVLADGTPVGHTDRDFFIKKITDFLKGNLDNPKLTLDDICQKAGMSRTHLNRKMAALTGMSTMQFLRSMRIERAKKLLADPRLSVSEVAYSSGFDDPKYFSRIFSKVVGMTPTAFREQ